MGSVLLVEDEAEIAALIREALLTEGLDVVVAATDEDALAALEAGGRALSALVTDINLGVGVTGFDVARRARQLNRKLPIVYITGHAAHMARFGVEDGVMMPKPFVPAELAMRVRSLIEDRFG